MFAFRVRTAYKLHPDFKSIRLGKNSAYVGANSVIGLLNVSSYGPYVLFKMSVASVKIQRILDPSLLVLGDLCGIILNLHVHRNKYFLAHRLLKLSP
jgi:hypothetical protein